MADSCRNAARSVCFSSDKEINKRGAALKLPRANSRLRQASPDSRVSTAERRTTAVSDAGRRTTNFLHDPPSASRKKDCGRSDLARHARCSLSGEGDGELPRERERERERGGDRERQLARRTSASEISPISQSIEIRISFHESLRIRVPIREETRIAIRGASDIRLRHVGTRRNLDPIRSFLRGHPPRAASCSIVFPCRGPPGERSLLVS